MASIEDKVETHAWHACSDEDDFASVVAPLERVAMSGFNRSGKLRGDGRAVCWRAFLENRDGFRVVGSRALHEAARNPLGLLIWMVGQGEHLAAGPVAPTFVTQTVECFECDSTVDLAAKVGGQWYCQRCVGKAAA